MRINTDSLLHELDAIDRRLSNLDDSTITELENHLRQALIVVEAYREAQRGAFTPYDADPRSCGPIHSYT
jgi:hypothetical protein